MVYFYSYQQLQLGPTINTGWESATGPPQKHNQVRNGYTQEKYEFRQGDNGKVKHQKLLWTHQQEPKGRKNPCIDTGTKH